MDRHRRLRQLVGRQRRPTNLCTSRKRSQPQKRLLVVHPLLLRYTTCVEMHDDARFAVHLRVGARFLPNGSEFVTRRARKINALHDQMPEPEMPNKTWRDLTHASIEKQLHRSEKRIQKAFGDRDTECMLKEWAKILEDGIIEATGIEKAGLEAPRGRGCATVRWMLQDTKLPAVDAIRITRGKKNAEEQ